MVGKLPMDVTVALSRLNCKAPLAQQVKRDVRLLL